MFERKRTCRTAFGGYWGDWGAPDPVLGGLTRADNAADQALAAAVMTVALEAVGPIADEARTAIATIASARMRGQAIDRILGAEMASMTPQARADYAPAFAAAGEDLKNAFALPLPNEAAESRFMASVRNFLLALRSDAAATLESV